MADKVYTIEFDYDCAEEAMDLLEQRGYGDYAVITDDAVLQVTLNPEEMELDEILDILEDGEYDYTVEFEEEVYEDVESDEEETDTEDLDTEVE